VILPFEVQYYRERGIPVLFAGHPMLDDIMAPPSPKHAPSRDDRFDVILFPGSRKQEVSRHLGPMLDAARMIRTMWPKSRFRIGAAPLIDKGMLEIPPEMSGYVTVTRRGIEELPGAALVIASSGTVTLQVAMSGTPMIVIYRTSGVTYMLARSMVKIPWIAMPNVLAGEQVVPELVQGDAAPGRIAGEADAILSDWNRYGEISSRLLSLRDSLRSDGGMKRLARRALSMAGKR